MRVVTNHKSQITNHHISTEASSGITLGEHIVIATRNRHKFEEIVEILEEECGEFLIPNSELRTPNSYFIFAGDIADLPEVEEDGDSLYENALKKAKEVAEYTGVACLADDTGFFVRALNGEPGINAAIYAGKGCTYDDNVNKLLSMMQGKEDNYAYFQTVCVYYDPTAKTIIATEGILEGHIISDKRGKNGFGYDPVFVPLGSEKTLSEMSEVEKNKISHRRKAISQFLRG